MREENKNDKELNEEDFVSIVNLTTDIFGELKELDEEDFVSIVNLTTDIFGKVEFLSMSMWTTDSLEDPDQFYKDMVSLESKKK